MMTQEEAYDFYAPWIQEYIYKKGWSQLTPLQIAAVEAIEEGTHNLLFMAGTARGKTEAAFLPCISKLAKSKDSSGVGILYISPLKALINDQFLRLEELLRENQSQTEIRLTKWHGDALLSQKEKLLSNFDINGILQTTPESLEAMFCLHSERIPLLFSNLKYVIIDEVHYFMDSQRGYQLMILLDRIRRKICCDPILIGLSATIANPMNAISFLSEGSGREGKVLAMKSQGTTAFCAISASRIGKEAYPERYIKKLWKQTQGKRTLLFTNSRRNCEQIVYELRKYCKENGHQDIYHLHHSSISKQVREDTEATMKSKEDPICTVSTTTLELGIDLGSLEEVVQADVPFRISSMVQRLGRSGRRNGRSMISFLIRHMEDHGALEELDLSLIRAIAMVELYFKEHYMESIEEINYPYGLLAHTILSTLCEKGCLPPHLLAYHVLELQVFQHISQDDFRDLLNKMLEKKYLILYDDGMIGLNDAGEQMVNSMNFYSVFQGTESITVYAGQEEIGFVETFYSLGRSFYLNGMAWTVVDRDFDRSILKVVPMKEEDEEIRIRYSGKSFSDIDGRIMEKMHEILSSEESYGYIDNMTKGILDDLRLKWKSKHLDERIITEGNNLMLCPSLSTKTLTTLYHIFKSKDIHCEEVYLKDTLYGIRIFSDSLSNFRHLVRNLAEEKHLIDYGYIIYNIKYQGKYGDLLPDHLKAKEILQDQLNVEEARNFINILAEELYVK